MPTEYNNLFRIILKEDIQYVFKEMAPQVKRLQHNHDSIRPEFKSPKL